MINKSVGVKTWGENQTAARREEGPMNISATEKAKLGDRDVGEVLNQIADPNWIDPSKKMRTVGNDKLDKDAFFRLMIAQMKHQDPGNPMQSHEMAAQLASFTSLEQMQNMNKTLDSMAQAQKPSENFQALSYIGKAVAGDSSSVLRTASDKEHDFRFDLSSEAKEVVVKIKNADGDVVRTYNLNNLKKGANQVTWNGEDDKGAAQNPGEYSFTVEAKAEDGKKLVAKTNFDGIITGVNYTSEGPVLMVGNQTVRLKDVRKIVDPSLKQNDQNINKVEVQDLKNTIDTKQNESNSNASKTSKGVMESVGLSREMMNRLVKETSPDSSTEKKSEPSVSESKG